MPANARQPTVSRRNATNHPPPPIPSEIDTGSPSKVSNIPESSPNLPGHSVRDQSTPHAFDTWSQRRTPACMTSSSSHRPGHTGAVKRQRTVEGSCWACKQRRVKCDLQKPACRRCQLSDSECCYDKVLLRWDSRRSQTAATPAVPSPSPREGTTFQFSTSLAVSEKKALDYFRGKLWPLLSTADDQCQPPISIALRSQAVLQAACIFAETHRALDDRTASSQSLINRRVNCLAAIREDLADETVSKSVRHALLLAVLLLYHSDGFVDCLQPHASPASHHAGALAIIQSLGGFDAVRRSASNETICATMLLSEFATTDVIESVLRGTEPSFVTSIWDDMESTPVWWQAGPSGSITLGTVLQHLSVMASYAHELGQANTTADPKKVADFEQSLQPIYPSVEAFTAAELGNQTASEDAISRQALIDSHILTRAFQHAALIHLYRAICRLSTSHPLVQQTVNACLDVLDELPPESKANNCTLFPLYVAGAHALEASRRASVLQGLEGVHRGLGFESVVAVRMALKGLWNSSEQLYGWLDTFRSLAKGALVL